MHVLRMQQLELTDDKCCVRSGEQTNCCKRETANRNGNSACCAKNASTTREKTIVGLQPKTDDNNNNSSNNRNNNNNSPSLLPKMFREISLAHDTRGASADKIPMEKALTAPMAPTASKPVINK